MKVGIAEAKAKLAALVARAEAGEEVILTRKGKPVAQISQILPAAAPNAAFGALPAAVGPWPLPEPPKAAPKPQNRAGLTLRDITRAALDG